MRRPGHDSVTSSLTNCEPGYDWERLAFPFVLSSRVVATEIVRPRSLSHFRCGDR